MNVVKLDGLIGVSFSAATSPVFQQYRIENCIFYDNGGYGVSVTDSDATSQVICDTNAFYNNTSGATLNTTDLNAITMTADPFTDSANGDFSLNSDAGGGALVDTEGLSIAN